MNNVRVLTWPLGRHDFRGANAMRCLLCGELRTRVVSEAGLPCVPRASQAPEGCVTSLEARSRLGLSKDVFVTRYQTRNVPPSYVHISSGAYYWSPENLHNLGLSDAEHKAKRKRAP